MTGGDKLQAFLQGYAERVTRAHEVSIGFLEGATYPDGTTVATIAAIQEFGGTIRIPAHMVTMFRAVDANGNFKPGASARKTEHATHEAQYEVPEHTVTIPARPFFRQMIAKNSATWGDEAAALLREQDGDMTVTLGLMGNLIASQLRDSILEFTDPSLAPATVRRKGFSKPLIETSHMLNSVDYVVGDE